jgi:RNA polymerase sigma-70 factor (ECF subfamily)
MMEIFNEHRQMIFGVAYRMLGRVAEAEDIVQETWVRWQKQNAADIQSPKAWLVSTATRLCIDQLRSARRQREEYYGVWLPEPLMERMQMSPTDTVQLAESLTTAFMLMLEALDPVERAAFLLREVFDYDYADIATTVGKSEANCRQIVRRAKASLQMPNRAPQPPTELARKAVEKFVAATTSGQVDELLALLAEDVTFYSDGGGKVRAAGQPIHSADHVCRLLVGIRRLLPPHLQMTPVSINGAPGVLLRTPERVVGALSFQFGGERIQNIYGVWNPEKLKHLATS